MAVWPAAVLLVALSPGAASAGWWLLAAVVLAAALALAARRTLPLDAPADVAPVVKGITLAVPAGMLATCAAVFAAYLAPGPFPAIGFVAAVTAARLAGVRLSGYWMRWCLGLLLVACAAFVAVCLALAPPVQAAPTTGLDLSGLLLAAAVCFPLFARSRGTRLPVFAGTAVVGLAVAAVALYQLGPARLGLTPTAVREVLAAADAAVLAPALGPVVLLAAVPAALQALTPPEVHVEPEVGEHRAPRSRIDVLAVAVAAALLAGTLPVPGVLAVTAALALVEVGVSAAFSLARRRAVLPAAIGVLAVALLVVLPPRYLLVAVLAAGVLTAWMYYRERGAVRTG